MGVWRRIAFVQTTLAVWIPLRETDTEQAEQEDGARNEDPGEDLEENPGDKGPKFLKNPKHSRLLTP